MAKSQNIKGYYKMNKVTLFEKLLDGLDDKYDRIKFILCIDNNLFQKSFENEDKDACNIVQANSEVNLKSEMKTEKYFCVHRRYKYSCRDCKGSLICPHDRQKYYCLDCPGSVFAPTKDASIFVETAKGQEFADMVNRDLFVGHVVAQCFANSTNGKIIVRFVRIFRK